MSSNPATASPFVNRQEEIEQIRDKLTALKNHKIVFNFIFTISGIPGIGKTTLLTQAATEAKALNISSLLLDYEQDKLQDHPLQTLQHIVQHFLLHTPSWSSALKDYQEHDGHPVQAAYYWERLVDAFVQDFKTRLAETPLLLLFDNSDKIPITEAGNLIQETLETILERVSPQNRLLVLIGGRALLRWHSFELRRRTHALTLNALPKEETARLLPDVNYASLSDQVYAVTQGYPKASVLAYQWAIENLKSSPAELPHHFAERERELILELFNAIFKEYILSPIKDVQQRYLIRDLLRYVSPLRRFDDVLLAELLHKVDDKRFSQVNTLDARSYTRLMAAQTYLIKWDSGRQAYALDHAIRRLLALELKYQEAERLGQIHQLALNWYEKAMSEVTQRDKSAPHTVIYLLEYIFHLAHKWQLQGPTDGLETDIQQKMIALFRDYYPRERIHFQEEFKKDEELAELLGPIYTSLTEFVAAQVEFDSQTITNG